MRISEFVEGIDPKLTGLIRNDVRAGWSEGILRCVLTSKADQLQTAEAFAYKWSKRDSYDTPALKELNLKWYLEKYGFRSLEDWVRHLNGRGMILDLGCGSGFSSSLYLESGFWDPQTVWVEVDLSRAIDLAKERLGAIPNLFFVQADLMDLPFAENAFDLIFSEGVLHHTPSTLGAMKAAAKVLKKGGEFDFYVYRRKGPAREFLDDHIRHQMEPLSEEEAWREMETLTRLAKNLTAVKSEIRVEEDIPLLGIKKGTQDIQRFIYWNFAKLYWNEALSFDENVHINFDWYRPKYAHRQSPDEIRKGCEEAGLMIEWFHEQESGITVRARKQ